METMRKIKIIMGKDWYETEVGKIFYVVNETNKAYIIDRGGGCFSFVWKRDVKLIK